MKTSPELLPKTMACPNCGGRMSEDAHYFVERGEWNGNSYSQEGHFPAFRCENPTCDTEIIVCPKVKEEV
jgi:hypothetical protein